MGMRRRADKDGNTIGFHNVIFDDIPDDYRIKKVILKGRVFDLSYAGVMRHLRDVKAADEFADDSFYSKEVIAHMAMDYLQSALYLQQGIVSDRGTDIVSYYMIPCAYLCKHAIELKLKECCMTKGVGMPNKHSVLCIWNELAETSIPNYQEISGFIEEVEKIDSNEIALRYGVLRTLEPVKEDFKFDIDSFLSNAKFLFNVVDEHIICRYRYK